MSNSTDRFSTRVLRWFAQHGRKDLPWQQNPHPYRVWVSEIMLQQTQVAAVIPYFKRFMDRFPDVASLASASQDEVLKHWSGLGYYARARNLHRAAIQVVGEHAGRFPTDLDGLIALPGIGRSTAGAILALAYGRRGVILDGNVKRVLSRYHAVTGWPGESAVSRKLWCLADQHTPHRQIAEYTQAIMDLGATLCTRTKPDCARCPLRTDCQAHACGNPQEYPQRKPKRDRPVRSAKFLILRNQHGEVLLKKRPEHGVWGGLWSFPELPEAMSVDAFLHDEGLSVKDNVRELPRLRHQFTHFVLDISPVLVSTSPDARCVREMAEPQQVWYKAGTELPGGCPAPVTQLLKQLEESHP